MSLPAKEDLQFMGYTYNGQPFVEVDAQTLLTSPGYMGVTYNGQPVTFAPLLIVPIVDYRRINVRLSVGNMGIKRPHLP